MWQGGDVAGGDVTIADADRQAPIDNVVQRLNDPDTAAALVVLLDNAEFLSVMVEALGGFVGRGDAIMDAVAESVNELKATQPADADRPSLSELTGVASQLASATPVFSAVLSSPMVEPETIDLLSMLSSAATEGVDTARGGGSRVNGVRGMLKALKDPDVQEGFGVLIEISRSLGRRVRTSN